MDQAITTSIEQKIQLFLVEKFPMARKAGIQKQTSLLERGILDSLGILDVVSFLETEFSIVIGDDELLPENFQTLAALTAFVMNKLGKAQ